jgi:hypothetical protein
MMVDIANPTTDTSPNPTPGDTSNDVQQLPPASPPVDQARLEKIERQIEEARAEIEKSTAMIRKALNRRR